ncbi:FAD dependent oxidoreductase, partial [Mycena vulgaris]
MGTALSRLRLTLQSLRAISAAYEEVNKRIEESPGVPVLGPSTPYWAIPPSPIAQHGSEALVLPHYADVLIIGSGITGTAVSRTLLSEYSKDAAPDLRVIMLEARDACSGATARNGGHITPLLYHDYLAMKKELGAEMAKSIIEFRLAHLAELIQVSKEEDILADSQCREVETFDVFFDHETYELAIRNLAAYLNDIPEQRRMWRVVGVDECVKDLQLSERTVGAIATTAGAVHPYRLVTGILSRLLASHSTNFRLFTHTPCISISLSSGSENEEPFYIVSTNKGTIRARHVVHATNAWVSHLVPPMRGKIVPVRGHMSAQRPGMGLGAGGLKPHPLIGQTPLAGANDSVLTLTEVGASSAHSWLGTRSFVMYAGGRYDYLTQQPSASGSSLISSYPPPAAEFMFGGGVAHGEMDELAFMNEVGITDDRSWSLDTGAYLSGALSMHFGGWGAEGRDIEGNSADKSTIVPSPVGMESDEGRVKKLWSGILSVSADGRPWVGRLPAKISGRPAPRTRPSRKHKSAETVTRLAPPGEWISAGYSGEGMVHAYLSGKALAHMILGHDEHGRLPEAYLVTEARWKKANVENLIGAYV